MRLLILTQKVDINDNNLGFFHRWIEEFAKHYESVVVVCLQKGEYWLPPNVKVISLGKERDASRIKYLWNFYKYIFKYKNNYDGVFVHMNKEYVLLGGLLWKLWHKKIALWYTHKAVSWQLKLAEKIVDKIFTASKESFRLSSKKVEITGHGIPRASLNYNNLDEHQVLKHRDTLFLLSVGRVTPSKDWETVIRAVAELQSKKIVGLKTIIYHFAGDIADPRDEQYRDKLLKMGREITEAGFSFHSYPPEQMSNIYLNHHILIHTSRTGSVDKVVLEALASGRMVITSSEAFVDLAKEGLVYTFPEGDCQELAKTIEKIYNSGIILHNERGIEFVKKNHNLENVVGKILDYFKTP